MGLRSFFHKIKIGFARMNEHSIPYTSAAKKYGDGGEESLVLALQSRLQDSKIKKNIIVQTSEGNAEIDCLILYKNKLFAIEIKRWKGQLWERNGDFVQYKRDRWTGEIHTKIHKSPFKQLGRAVYLLRKQIPDNAWINTIVFFEESDSINIESDNIWFNNIDNLVEYIVNNGKLSWANNSNAFFEKCIAADYLYCSSWGKSLHCTVCDDSLRFNTSAGVLDRSKILSISISHHWSYDEIKITTLDGNYHSINVENGSVYVINNGYRCRYALCKLDYIRLGREFY